MVNAFDQWRAAYLDDNVDARQFCQAKFLSFSNLVQIEETRDQLLRLLIGVKSVGSDVVHRKKYRLISYNVFLGIVES